jgi:methyl-accepting chemotaxis protein
VPGLSERDIVVDVTIRSDTKGSDKAAESLGRVDKAATHAGGSLGHMASESKKLDAEITKSTARIKELEQTMVATGDRTLRRSLASERSWLAELEKIGKKAATPANLNNFGGFDFSGFAAESRGFLIAGGAGAAAAMSPMIAGVVSAAVVGAVGIGGVVGGAVLASKHPIVKQAWHDLGDDIMRELKPAGDAFVFPMVEATRTLGKGFADSGLSQELAKASNLVDPLAKGIAGFVRELGPGIGAAFKAAEPVLGMLAKELPEMGKSMSAMFAGMERGSDGAVLALKDTLNVSDRTLESLGEAFDVLSGIYALTRSPFMQGGLLKWTVDTSTLSRVDDLLTLVTHSNEKLITKEDKARAASKERTKAIESQTEALKNWATALDDANDAYNTAQDKLSSRMNAIIPDALSLEDAQDGAADALARLDEQIQKQKEAGVEGAGSLKGFTQAARDNRDMVRDITKMYGGLIVQTAIAGGNTDELKKSFEDQLIAMGFSRDEIQEYIDMLNKIPVEKITKVALDNRRALEQVEETDRELRRLERDRTTVVNVVTQGQAVMNQPAYSAPAYTPPAYTPPAYTPPPGRGFQQFGDGGMIKGPLGSPQLVVGHAGELVLNAEQQLALFGGGGPSQPAARPVTVSGNAVVQGLIEMIRQEVRAQGGELAVLGLKS